MFLRAGLMTLITLSLLSPSAYAIIFDASCSVYQEKLEEAFRNAFTLANLAAQNLNPPVREPYSGFAEWLFGDQANWGEAHERLGEVKDIPATISSNKKDKSNLNDVVVYCNMDRYRKIKAGPYRDTDLNELIYADDDLLMCKTGNSIDGQRRPKAITNSYTDANDPDNYADIMTTIDLCNWYLEVVKRSQWTTASGVASEVNSATGSESLGSMLAGALKGIAQGLLGPGKKDIDTLALVDHTLLHELTHARAVGKSQTKLGVKELYGWPACTDKPTPYNSDDGTAAIGPDGLIETPQSSSNNSPGDPHSGSQGPPRRRRLMGRTDEKRNDRLV